MARVFNAVEEYKSALGRLAQIILHYFVLYTYNSSGNRLFWRQVFGLLAAFHSMERITHTHAYHTLNSNKKYTPSGRYLLRESSHQNWLLPLSTSLYTPIIFNLSSSNSQFEPNFTNYMLQKKIIKTQFKRKNIRE